MEKRQIKKLEKLLKKMKKQLNKIAKDTNIFLKRYINSVECNMYPKKISGTEPIIINFNNSWLCLRLNKSFLKKNIIASKEPKCKLISINKELALRSYKLDTIIKWADELIGKNSDTPWTVDNIRISIKSWNIWVS